MELTGKFLPQFKVRQPQLPSLISINKPDSLPVVGMFTRETFPAQYYRWKHLEVHCNNDQSIQHLARSKNETSKLPELSFDRLQLTDQECSGLQRRSFGRFIARGAILDEEYWEFYALKRRCFGQEGNSLNCFCFVAVKKEEKNVRRTVLNSIVGTLDLSIRQFVQGETYPEDNKRLSAVLASQEPFDTHKYAYIANVCVAKFARRQGIALNMLYLATDVASVAGMKQLFVHVNADNKPAQDLYKKTGFKAPLVPLPRDDGPSFNPSRQNGSQRAVAHPLEQGIPIIISWSYGGNVVSVEGSWDNWSSRKILQRSGKDHSILLILPSAVYRYRFIVDGEVRSIPDLPSEADDMGRLCNLLDVHDYVPENLNSVAEFEAPPSPDSSYTQDFPGDEDFAKDPMVVPPQLQSTVLGSENCKKTASSSKPQHVVLNHLFVDKGWSSQSVVALGLTHRFQSKYVTVVLYKPLKR